MHVAGRVAHSGRALAERGTHVGPRRFSQERIRTRSVGRPNIDGCGRVGGERGRAPRRASRSRPAAAAACAAERAAGRAARRAAAGGPAHADASPLAGSGLAFAAHAVGPCAPPSFPPPTAPPESPATARNRPTHGTLAISMSPCRLCSSCENTLLDHASHALPAIATPPSSIDERKCGQIAPPARPRLSPRRRSRW